MISSSHWNFGVIRHRAVRSILFCCHELAPVGFQFTERALAHHLLDPLGGPSTRYYVALGLLHLQTHDMDKVEMDVNTALQFDYQVSQWIAR